MELALRGWVRVLNIDDLQMKRLLLLLLAALTLPTAVNSDDLKKQYDNEFGNIDDINKSSC